MRRALLNREQIESLIVELGERCAAKNVHVEMFVVGDAAMALA